jgi:hypothetical protein
VLFQVYDGEKAYWDTQALPVDSDRLGPFVPLAREAGLEVHAWMPMLPCRVGAILERHREWTLADQPHLDPSSGEVGAFLAARVRELSEVPGVTGVHADELRYPEGLALDDAKREGLTRLVNDHLVPAAHGRERSLTAAVMGAPTVAGERFGQDWPRWTVNAVFARFSPPGETLDLDWIHGQAREAAKAATVPVCAGLSVASLDFGSTARAVRAALDGGVSGVCLHSLRDMTEERWMGLQIVVVGQRPD